MKIYVGNLSKQVTDSQLNELALPFGKPESASVITERSGGTTASRGFGFIQFNSDDEARAAIAGLNGKEVHGQNLKVNEAKPTGSPRR